jgi:hypothetical protein
MRLRPFSLIAATLFLTLVSGAATAAPPAPTTLPPAPGPTLTVTAEAPIAMEPTRRLPALYLRFIADGKSFAAASAALQAKLQAAEKALVALGIPASSITLQNVSNSPAEVGVPFDWMSPGTYTTPPDSLTEPAAPGSDGSADEAQSASGGAADATTPADGAGAAPTAAPPAGPVWASAPKTFPLVAHVQVEVSSQAQLFDALVAGIGAGAISVSTSPSFNAIVTSYDLFGPTSFTAAAQEDAMRKATADAQRMAKAQAEAAHVTLGNMLQMTTESLSPSLGGGWRVVVHITYQVSPAQ